MECAGQLRVSAGDEAHDFTRVVGAELVLDWPGRAGLLVELRVEGPGRRASDGADLLLAFLGGVGDGSRCGPAIRFTERKGLLSARERLCFILGEVDRRGVKHETRDETLAEF